MPRERQPARFLFPAILLGTVAVVVAVVVAVILVERLQEPARPAHAGEPVLARGEIEVPAFAMPVDARVADEFLNWRDTYPGLVRVLELEPPTLYEHANPDLELELLLADPEAYYGQVLRVRGGLKQLRPMRDAPAYPEGVDEAWTAYLFDQRAGHQAYRVIYPGTPAPDEIELEGERVVVYGIFTGIHEYEDRELRRHSAPILVVREILRLRVD